MGDVLRPGLVIDLVNQMEMSSLLPLNVDDRAIGDFLVGLPVQRHPDRKVAPAYCFE